MKSTETAQPSAPRSTDVMTPADVQAHVEAPYVRRTAVVEETILPPLPPAGTPARRRALQQRGW